MSDRYHYTLNFDLRRDTPPSLIAAIKALRDGRKPTKEEMPDLPGIVQSYLVAGDFAGQFEENGPITRLGPLGIQYSEERPEDAVYRLHFERVFHDDEFWNGGMYLIYWLFQFAAGSGQLGTMHLEFDAPPEIITKSGDDIITTKLRYNPLEYAALDYRQGPLDPSQPIVVEKSSRTNLAQVLQDIAFMADGFDAD